MADKTLGDFIAKDNKKLPFEERAQKFQENLKPLVEEWGVAPWAGIQQTQEAILSVPMLKDLWDSGKE